MPFNIGWHPPLGKGANHHSSLQNIRVAGSDAQRLTRVNSRYGVLQVLFDGPGKGSHHPNLNLGLPGNDERGNMPNRTSQRGRPAQGRRTQVHRTNARHHLRTPRTRQPEPHPPIADIDHGTVVLKTGGLVCVLQNGRLAPCPKAPSLRQIQDLTHLRQASPESVSKRIRHCHTTARPRSKPEQAGAGQLTQACGAVSKISRSRSRVGDVRHACVLRPDRRDKPE